MRIKFVLALLASFAVLLSGCGGNKESRSVAYYKEHIQEAQQKQDQCQKDQVDFQKDNGCRNAAEAISQSGDFTPSPHKEW